MMMYLIQVVLILVVTGMVKGELLQNNFSNG